jgi:leucyl aminopeptidase
MEIKTATGDIAAIKADAIIVNHYEGTKTPEGGAAVDKALGGAIAQLIKQGDIKGKTGEINLIHSLGRLPAGRVAVVGLGKKKEIDVNKLRGAVGEACRYLRGKGAASIATGIPDIKTGDAVQAITEGAVLGLYTFRRHMTKKKDNAREVKQLVIAGGEKAKIAKAIARGQVMAEAAVRARDMVNEPSNFMTPEDMAGAARQIAKEYGLKVEVFEKDKIKEMGMGGLIGVSQGSQQPPKFIILTYEGRQSKDIDLALVGKGITFDSGGISIKPSEHMEAMKGDMAGGAAVMGAIMAVARLKPALNVTALIPATENLPSGSAQKPGDVLTAMNGKTIEVINTDAEGRLILADALSYASKLGARAIVDTATLTGACQGRLGNICTGAFSNNQPLLYKVLAAGKEAGEAAWRSDVRRIQRLSRDDVADIKNTGNRYGGAITAAKFLRSSWTRRLGAPGHRPAPAIPIRTRATRSRGDRCAGADAGEPRPRPGEKISGGGSRMKIKYLAHAAFLITADNGVRILTDPYATSATLKYGEINVTADIVTVSHEHGDHNNAAAVRGDPAVLRDTAEAKGIKFRAVPAAHDEQAGRQRGRNTIFCFTVDGVNICHAGDIGHALSEAQPQAIGKVDVRLIPVGGSIHRPATAAHLGGQLQPSDVPMHYKTARSDYPIAGVDEFIRGKDNVTDTGGSEIELKAGALPAATQIIVLKPSL